jgi:DNA-binding CsgD family transcriptional regulator
VFDLLGEVAAADSADTIVDLLHLYATTYLASSNILFYGVWRILPRPNDYRRGYKLGKSLFIHADVHAHFAEHIAMARQRGSNILSHMSWVRRTPFTITECLREMRPTEPERWAINLLREHGMRDGLYCPVNGWVVLFWSPKVLRLTSRHRGFLFSLATQASMRLDEIVPMQDERRVRLSARELAVLQYMSNGVSDEQIAHEMGIGPGTIRTYVVRAMGKLGVKTREHAVAEALRRMLVK